VCSSDLGFVTVNEGDLLITPLGGAYANATILGRKAILAGRVLRLPMIAWIYETLQRDDDHRIARDYFYDRLQAEFGDRAKPQLDLAIDWGRHAELFAYDDDTEELYLETPQDSSPEKAVALSDLYAAWPVLSARERVDGFRLLSEQEAEDFFLQLTAQDKAELLLALYSGERKSWLRRLGAEEATEVLRSAPEEHRGEVMALLDDKTRREVKGLLDYAEQRKGGRIHAEYAELNPEMTVDEAISFLRRDARDRAETVYYAYVTDSEERLLGIVSFRDLLLTPGDKAVRTVMRTDVIAASEDSNPQQLRELFIRYNLQIIPIVDTEKHIKRIVTRD